MRTGAHGDSAERRSKTCCSATDAVDARAVADRLDIPFYALDFERDFARIMDEFADEYAAGRTPNPCVLCNIWLKFGKLWAYGKRRRRRLRRHRALRPDRADDDGRPRGSPGRSIRSRTSRTSSSGSVASCWRTSSCPVGGFTKAEIRAIARDAGPAGPRQARQPGDLLRPRRRLPRGSSATAGPDLDTAGADRRRGRHGARRARRDRGVHDRPAAGAGDRRGRAPLRRPDRADEPDGHGRPPRVARPAGPGGVAVQLASRPARRARPAASPRSGPGTGPCPRPSSRWRATGPGSCSTSPSRPSRRGRSSRSTRATWSSAAAGSTGPTRSSPMTGVSIGMATRRAAKARPTDASR